MTAATALRIQIEHALERRFPAALTPVPRTFRETVNTGIQGVDTLMEGGFPLGAISEVTGPQSSGRTSLVLSFLTQRTHENQVVAWVDAEDAFDPESAAANSVSLRQLLWVTLPECYRASQGASPGRGSIRPFRRPASPACITGSAAGGSPYLLRLQPVRFLHHCRCRCWKRCLPCCHSFNQIHVETLLSAMGASGLSFLLAKFTWQIGPMLRACV